MGARLIATSVGVFARGAASAFLTGSDRPDLDASRFTSVAESLQESDTVLIPARDGRHTLLGLKAAHLLLFA